MTTYGSGGGSVGTATRGNGSNSFRLTTYGQQQGWYSSDRDHLFRTVSALAKAGIEFRFAESPYGHSVYVRSADGLFPDSMIGSCSASDHAQMLAIVERERPRRPPKIEARPEPKPEEWMSLVDKEIANLQADWALMTDDGRMAKLAAIRQRLQARR